MKGSNYVKRWDGKHVNAMPEIGQIGNCQATPSLISLWFQIV